MDHCGSQAHARAVEEGAPVAGYVYQATPEQHGALQHVGEGQVVVLFLMVTNILGYGKQPNRFLEISTGIHKLGVCGLLFAIIYNVFFLEIKIV